MVRSEFTLSSRPAEKVQNRSRFLHLTDYGLIIQRSFLKVMGSQTTQSLVRFKMNETLYILLILGH